MHRDKTRVQMPAKMFPHFKQINMLAVNGPRSCFWHKAKKQFLDQIWCFFTIKTRFWQHFSWLNKRKSHLLMFLVLFGPIISRFFYMFKWGKKLTKTTKGACSSPISMVLWHWDLTDVGRQSLEGDVVGHGADDAELVAVTVPEVVGQEGDEGGATNNLGGHCNRTFYGSNLRIFVVN